MKRKPSAPKRRLASDAIDELRKQIPQSQADAETGPEIMQRLNMSSRELSKMLYALQNDGVLRVGKAFDRPYINGNRNRRTVYWVEQ